MILLSIASMSSIFLRCGGQILNYTKVVSEFSINVCMLKIGSLVRPEHRPFEHTRTELFCFQMWHGNVAEDTYINNMKPLSPMFKTLKICSPETFQHCIMKFKIFNLTSSSKKTEVCLHLKMSKFAAYPNSCLINFRMKCLQVTRNSLHINKKWLVKCVENAQPLNKIYRNTSMMKKTMVNDRIIWWFAIRHF